MKHLNKLVLLFVFSLFLALPAVAQADNFVVVKDLEGVRCHSMLFGPGMNAAHIFETPNKLVIMDTAGTIPQATALRAYAESLGKPIERVVLSHAHGHHVLGAYVFKDLPIYALAETIEQIKAEGPTMVAEDKQRPGGEGVPDVATVPQHVLKEGQERIDGVLFNWMNIPIGMPICFADLPEAGALVTHHMVYNGMHAFLSPVMEPWKAGLKKFQSMGRKWIMAAHGIPAGPEVWEKQLKYIATAENIIAAAPTLELAAAGIANSYPSYGAAFLLGASLPPYYAK